MNINDVREAMRDLSRKGLTPLDLFSWVFLLDLNSRYKSFDGIDLDIHHQMQQDIHNALWRKAKMLDDENGSDFHREMLRNMNVPAMSIS